METRFAYEGQDLYTPVVFRSDFNNFAKLSATQAWSMFFTASQEERALGSNPEVGRFFTNLLIAAGVAFVVGSIAYFS